MKKVVLIDDVSISNFIMKKIISNVAPDITIFDFTDPSIALSNLETIDPDLIFLDLNMPHVNGFQFLESMKEKQLPYKVIIVSSSTSDMDKQQSLAYGNVLQYLSKPPKKDEVAAVFSAAI